MGERSYKENNLYIEWYIMKVENEIYDILYKEMCVFRLNGTACTL